MRIPPRYHKIDGWRGYWIPGTAVAGASVAGTWYDSPAPSDNAAEEIERFRREALRSAGIRSRVRFGITSNVFVGKLWVTVAPRDYERAAALAADWLEANRYSTRYIHDAGPQKDVPCAHGNVGACRVCKKETVQSWA